MDTNQQKCWIGAIEKEEFLRMKWFKKNQTRLEEIAHKSKTKKVPDSMKADIKQNIINRYSNVEKYAVIKKEIVPPEMSVALRSIMKPVHPSIKKLIYTGSNKDGRINYINERANVIPEERYYFPETANFVYGWNMWNCARTMKKTGFGRQKMLRDTFYRRRGTERDPDWYREPDKLSSTICK